MEILVQNQTELLGFGGRLGSVLESGDTIELVGDVGAGKTTLVGAIAAGLGVDGEVTSPSYTLSQVYELPDGQKLAHYDFYRLSDPGILSQELAEVMSSDDTIVAIEWADVVADILPIDHLRIEITPTGFESRQLKVTAGGDRSQRILEQLA